MGVPGYPLIIRFNRMFPYKPSSYLDTPIYGNLRFGLASSVRHRVPHSVPLAFHHTEPFFRWPFYRMCHVQTQHPYGPIKSCQGFGHPWWSNQTHLMKGLSGFPNALHFSEFIIKQFLSFICFIGYILVLIWKGIDWYMYNYVYLLHMLVSCPRSYIPIVWPILHTQQETNADSYRQEDIPMYRNKLQQTIVIHLKIWRKYLRIHILETLFSISLGVA